MQDRLATPPSLDPARLQTSSNRIPLYGAAISVVVIAVVLMFNYSSFYRADACYERGRAALAVGDDDTVMREADRLIQYREWEPKAHLLRGLLLARRGQPTAALEQLERAGSDATIVEADAAAAQCLYQLGRFPEAIDAAHVALERDPQCTNARRWLAAAYYDLGAMPHAVLELNHISNEDPTDSRSDRLLGLIAKDGEDFQKAIEHYRESLRRDPRPVDRDAILSELAESLIKLGRFDEAQTELQGCQNSARILTLKAEAERGLGHFVEAERQLREAMTMDSKSFPAMLELGKMLLDLERVDEALVVLEGAAKLEPMNRHVHLQLSQGLQQAGKSDQAAIELQRMEEIKAIEREFTDLHESIAKQPENVEFRVRIAELASRLGKPELAKMWLQAARSLAPNPMGGRSRNRSKHGAE